MMKIIALLFLLGSAAGASLDPLKDLRRLLGSGGLRTKQRWDINSLLRRREAPDCYDIYSCTNSDVTLPSGNVYTGFTFTTNFFHQLCTFSSEMKQCYDASDFYQSCDDLNVAQQQWSAYSYFCEEAGETALQKVIPCLNNNKVQDVFLPIWKSYWSDRYADNFDTCEYVAEFTRSVLQSINKNCGTEAYAAAVALEQHVSPGLFLAADLSSC